MRANRRRGRCAVRHSADRHAQADRRTRHPVPRGNRASCSSGWCTAGYRSREALIIFFGIRARARALGFFLFMATSILDAAQSVLRAGRLRSSATCCRAWCWPALAKRRAAPDPPRRFPTPSTCSSSALKRASGLDQAMQRVGDELAFAYPDLSDELRLINLELRAGKARVEALRNLADRTGVDDICSLVTMLVQTDKFGTSVAQSLRVHSDTVRTKRRQRAEEAAAKTGVKMVFPLVFCIFPAIWVVTHWPGRDQVHPGPRSRWRRNEHERHRCCHRRRQTRRSAAGAAGPDARSRRPGLHLRSGRAAADEDAVRRRGDRASLAERMRLPYAMLEPLIQRARTEQLVEVRGATGSGTAGYRYALTDLGRDRARQYLDMNHYVGPAPVPLAAYVAYDASAAGGARLHRPRSAARGLRAPRHQRRRCSSSSDRR